LSGQNLRLESNLIGTVVRSSLDEECNEQDWAICDLEEDHFSRLKDALAINCIPKSRMLDGKPLNVVQVADRPCIEHEALVATASKGVVKGVLSATPSFYRAPGNLEFIEILTVRLEEALSEFAASSLSFQT
jgi:hypothetical protein